MWAIAGVLLVGACAFDADTDYAPSFDEPRLETPELGEVSPAPNPDALVYLATGEETRRGALIAGSFEDSFAPDGLVEIIEAEVDKDDEKLEHDWTFAALPAGSYQLTLVGLPYSPEPVDEFILEYAVLGVRGHSEILLLQSSNSVMTYEGDVTLEQPAEIKVRVKLPKRTPTLDDEEIPFRRIDVDYLVLTPQAI